MSTDVINKIGETFEERYSRCEFLKTVQHIDIYGRNKSSYAEHKLKTDQPLVASLSKCPSKLTERIVHPDKTCLKDKLNKLSVTTKVCSLYPGNDILSKKSKLKQLSKSSGLIY